MTYPGGKAGAGVYQQIINRMPPHSVYVEPFLGGGAIMRMKRPARSNIGIEIDADVLYLFVADGIPNLELLIGDAVGYLATHDLPDDALVYCDPPYLRQVRRDKAQRYRYEFWTIADHESLLRVLVNLTCQVMISGYWSELYADYLGNWWTHRFNANTRGRTMGEEWLWMNYPPPVELHDYRFLGENYRERERIHRKQKRWAARLARMDVLERQALLSSIAEWRESSSSLPGRSHPDPAMRERGPLNGLPLFEQAKECSSYDKENNHRP